MTEAEARSEAGGDSIARGSARVLAARALASGAAFVAVFVLARALPPSGRGAVAFVMTTAFVLAGISGFGLDQATAVFAARRARDRASLLANLCLFSLVAAASFGVVCALLLAIAPSVRPASIGGLELLALVLGTICLRLNVAAAAFLSGCGRFRSYAISTTVPAALFAALLLVVLGASDVSVASACVVWAGAQLGGALVALYAAVRVGRFGRPSAPLAREAFPFGLRGWAGTVAGFLYWRVDQVIMGLITTEAALGFYAVAVNAAEVALYLPTAVAVAIVPSIARGTSEERIATTIRVFRPLLLMTIGVVAVGFACSPLIPVVFGSTYDPSVEPFLVLLPGAIAIMPLVIFTNALFASSAPERSSFGPIAALVVGVTLDFVLIPPFGATGAAIATTTALLAGAIVSVVAYILLTRIDPRMLLPHRSDLAFIGSLGRRFRGRRP